MSQRNGTWWRKLWALLVAVGAACGAPILSRAEPPVAEKPAAEKPASEKPKAKTAEDKRAEREKKAAEKKAAEKFLRIVRDDSGEPLAMETSIVSYKPKGDDRKGLVVDLIGAVHVGDGAYYDKLNKAFDEYEVVLYELVAPEGTKIPKGGRKPGESAHPVSAIQQALKNMLDLDFQLEKVDYTKKHFVHADMSPDEFSKTMEDRGESFLQLYFRMVGASLAQQSGKKGSSSDAEILLALLSPDRAFKLKRVMAEQFENLGGVTNALEGPKGSTIIGERNRKAFEVLKKEIDGGKKKIAVFYGAGHFPDMEKRLAKDFDLHPGEVKWIEAWDLRQKSKKK